MVSYAITLPQFPRKPKPNERRFNIGGVWELPEFSIVFDTTHDLRYHTPCEHALPGKDGKILVPRVVEAWNEGGHCSTGVCLDCIIDAAKTASARRSKKK